MWPAPFTVSRRAPGMALAMARGHPARGSVSRVPATTTVRTEMGCSLARKSKFSREASKPARAAGERLAEAFDREAVGPGGRCAVAALVVPDDAVARRHEVGRNRRPDLHGPGPAVGEDYRGPVAGDVDVEHGAVGCLDLRAFAAFDLGQGRPLVAAAAGDVRRARDRGRAEAE